MMGVLRALVAFAQISLKGGDGMDAIYARLIASTETTGWVIDRVPQVWKKKTLIALEALVLDGYGRPLY